jgi:outer membrane protein TolC
MCKGSKLGLVMKEKRLCWILMFFAVSVSCFATQVMQMTLKDAIDCVIKENLSLKGQKLSLDEKKLSRDTAWNFLYPDASLAASASQNFAYLNGKENKSSSSLGVSGSVSWSLRATDFFNIYQSINSYQLGKVDYDIAKSEIESKTVLYYYLLQVESQQIDLQKVLLDNSKNRLDSAKRGYRNSEVSRIELLRKEYNYKANQDKLTTLENSYQILMIRFKQLLNLPENTKLEFVDKLPEIEELNISQLENVNPQKTLSVFKLQLQEQKQNLENKKNIFRFLPYFSMSFSMGTDAMPSKKDWQDNTTQDISLRASVTLPLGNILPFSVVQTDVLKGKKAFERSRLATEEEMRNQNTEKLAGLTQIKQLLASCESHKENCNITKEAYQLSQRSYLEGELDYQTLSDTESDYQEATYNLLYVKYELVSSILEFGKKFNLSLQQLGVIK